VLDAAGRVEDPALEAPLPIEVMIRGANADDAIARALAAKHNPVIEAIRAECKAKGKRRKARPRASQPPSLHCWLHAVWRLISRSASRFSASEIQPMRDLEERERLALECEHEPLGVSPERLALQLKHLPEAIDHLAPRLGRRRRLDQL